MRLDKSQLKKIDELGYVIIPGCFSNEEVNNLRKAMTTVFNEKTEANIIEKSSGVVRTSMGLHLRSKIFDDLTRHPNFLNLRARYVVIIFIFNRQKLTSKLPLLVKFGNGITILQPISEKMECPNHWL